MVIHEPIIDKCEGCSRVLTGPEPGPSVCRAFLVPASKWRSGNCPMATHLRKDLVEDKKRMDPLKASKRKAAGVK
jgi:hypothetical protein